jgi:hypothetical protein
MVYRYFCTCIMRRAAVVVEIKNWARGRGAGTGGEPRRHGEHGGEGVLGGQRRTNYLKETQLHNLPVAGTIREH